MDDASAPQLVQQSDHPMVAEQYRAMIESADRISVRRGTANSFMMSLNTVLVTIAAVFRQAIDSPRGPVLMAVVGALASVIWWLTITSYSRLNSAKFAVIHEYERTMPSAPYTLEYWHLRHDKGATSYRTLSAIERLVPLLFLAFYVALAFMTGT